MGSGVYCRTCAHTGHLTERMIDIFSNAQIVDVFNSLKEWQLDIVQGDNLSQCICGVCELQLINMSEFKSQALKAKKYLQARLKSNAGDKAVISDNENDLQVESQSGRGVGANPREAVSNATQIVLPEFQSMHIEVAALQMINENEIAREQDEVQNDIFEPGLITVNKISFSTNNNELSRPPKFQTLLIEEEQETALQWLNEAGHTATKVTQTTKRALPDIEKLTEKAVTTAMHKCQGIIQLQAESLEEHELQTNIENMLIEGEQTQTIVGGESRLEEECEHILCGLDETPMKVTELQEQFINHMTPTRKISKIDSNKKQISIAQRRKPNEGIEKRIGKSQQVLNETGKLIGRAENVSLRLNKEVQSPPWCLTELMQAMTLQITNKSASTLENDTQIDEFETLLAAINEQVISFESGKDGSADVSDDLQSVLLDELTLQMISANVNILEDDLQIDEFETLLAAVDGQTSSLESFRTPIRLSEVHEVLANEPTRQMIQENVDNEKENTGKALPPSSENAVQGFYGAVKDTKSSNNMEVKETKIESYKKLLTQDEGISAAACSDGNELQCSQISAVHREGAVPDQSDLVFPGEKEPISNSSNIANNLSIVPEETSCADDDDATNVESQYKEAHKSERASLTYRFSPEKVQHLPPSTDEQPARKSPIIILANELYPLNVRCRLCVGKVSEQPVFATKQLLEDHVAMVHDDRERPYNCPHCASRYRTRSGCIAHINAIHLKKGGNCALCGKMVIGGAGQMRMHIERNHTHGDYTCEICQLELKNVSLYNFKYHKRWHENDKLWRCEHCGKVFVTRTHLLAHQVTHTRQGEFLCTHCGKSSRSKWELRAHLYAIHGEGEAPLNCDYCEQKFAQHAQKRAHLERHHPSELAKRTVACPSCEKQFYTKANLQRHLKQQHPNGNVVGSTAVNATPPYEGFQCAHCPRKFRAKYALIKHLEVHAKRVDRPYPCYDCDMHFKHFAQLDRHDLQHHATVRPFRCGKCTKAFSTKSALKAHGQVHEVKGRNFRCPECNQRFKFEKSLNLHRASHTKMRHSCNICNKTYIRLEQLMTHKSRYHQKASDSEEE